MRNGQNQPPAGDGAQLGECVPWIHKAPSSPYRPGMVAQAHNPGTGDWKREDQRVNSALATWQVSGYLELLENVFFFFFVFFATLLFWEWDTIIKRYFHRKHGETGWGYSSVMEHMSYMCKALGLVEGLTIHTCIYGNTHIQICTHVWMRTWV